MPNVQVIPAKKPNLSAQIASPVTKRRVAGYARVSTDKDEQLNSYEAQVAYYTDYIQSRTDWTFVSVFTDEGISALNTKKREGFKKMVVAALAGEIDLIVTKSVSRFAKIRLTAYKQSANSKKRASRSFSRKSKFGHLTARVNCSSPYLCTP